MRRIEVEVVGGGQSRDSGMGPWDFFCEWIETSSLNLIISVSAKNFRFHLDYILSCFLLIKKPGASAIRSDAESKHRQ